MLCNLRTLVLVFLIGLFSFPLYAQKVPSDKTVSTPESEEPVVDVTPSPAPASTVEDNAEELRATTLDGLPAWVEMIINGRYGDLVPPAGGYVGIGIGLTEGEAVASASIDFASNVSTTVTSTVSERQSGSEGSDEDEFEIESEVRSQAVLSGMRPWVHRVSDTEWYALYRIGAAEYQTKVQSWVENVALMGEAARQQELESLRRQRFEMEVAAEAERTAQREAELEAQRLEENRQMIARREESFLQSNLTSRILTVDTASVPSRHFWLFSDTRIGEDDLFDIRIGSGFQLFQLISIGIETGGYRSNSEEFSIPELGLSAKIRLMNNAGVAKTFSLAAGGKVLFDPRTWGDGASEVYNVFYVSAHAHIPKPLHGSYFVYLGNDRIAMGGQWAPFWRSLESTVVLESSVDLDLGYREYEIGSYSGMNVLLGIGFRPTQRVRIHLYTDSFTVAGLTLSIGM